MYKSLALLLTAITFSVYAGNCPKEGKKKDGSTPDAKTQQLNRQKNRDTEPGENDFVKLTVRRMLNSEDSIHKFNDSKAATITGYMFGASDEKGESCNCYAKDAAHHDIHVFIAPTKKTETIGECVVVEITPWTKKNNSEWTKSYLNSIKGHKVKITGWLMYDWEHTNVSAASDPEDDDPKRGTVWELHPITDLIDLDAVGSQGSAEKITPTSGPINNNPETTLPPEVPDASAGSTFDILLRVLLGALLGMTGQGIRVAVGLKKLNDATETKEHFKKEFDGKKLTVSLLYALIIGVIGGIMMAIDSMDKTWDKSTIMAIIAAGYAGADFIEGFMQKNLPSQVGSVPSKGISGTPGGTPKPGPIPQGE